MEKFIDEMFLLLAEGKSTIISDLIREGYASHDVQEKHLKEIKHNGAEW